MFGSFVSQLSRIFRASASGSLTVRHVASKTIVWHPSGVNGVHGKTRLAGITRTREVRPGGRHPSGQRLRLRTVTRPLRASRGIVEAEGELGGVPRAGVLEHR